MPPMIAMIDSPSFIGSFTIEFSIPSLSSPSSTETPPTPRPNDSLGSKSMIPSPVSGIFCDGSVTGEKLIDTVPLSLACSCVDAPLPPKKLLKKFVMSSKKFVSSPLVGSGVGGNEVPFLGTDVKSLDGDFKPSSIDTKSNCPPDVFVVTVVVCDFAFNLAVENTFDLPTFLALKLGDEVDAMNDEISGVSFDIFLFVMKTDFGLLARLFPNFVTLLVDLNLVKNGETNDFFGCFALISENLFDDFFDVNADALLALFFLAGLNLVRNFETCCFDVNDDALLTFFDVLGFGLNFVALLARLE